jgi:nucleoside-diphosphate-sugar epimerase
MKIIENKDGKASGQIFNIGNPDNNCTIKDLADKLIALFKKQPCYSAGTFKPRVVVKKAQNFYGESYQDISTRVPSIENAGKLLGWKPKVALDDALQLTLKSFLKEAGL